MENLQVMPKIRDRLSYLYVEHAKIDKEDKSISIHDAIGKTPVPCAGLTLLMLGPGISITHAAIMVLAECGCLVAWTGEQAVRFYAAGTGTTRSAGNLYRQVAAWADKEAHLKVVRQMYEMRFDFKLDSSLSLEQIRGKEGVRVRDTYFRLSRQHNVPMETRSYDRQNWKQADPINRAISVANSCMYGICHAAIVAAGYSPALGFVHTGKQLSFVYDIADLYKMEMSVPAAFQAVASGSPHLDREVRLQCRDMFHTQGLLKRVVSDIHSLFSPQHNDEEPTDDYDSDPAAPGQLWDPDKTATPGGVLYTNEEA